MRRREFITLLGAATMAMSRARTWQSNIAGLKGPDVQLPEMAADLVRRQVSVIVANTPPNLAAKNATSTIRIVFITGVDPVHKWALVSNLRRTGGNVAGVRSLKRKIS